MSIILRLSIIFSWNKITDCVWDSSTVMKSYYAPKVYDTNKLI